MKYVNEFRDAGLARAVAAEITARVAPDRRYKIMEICGGHTHTIYRHGIKDLLPPQIELVHGPGCPVCVLPMGRVDEGIAIAERPEVVFTCFGDMMRVPGSKGSLLEVKARGADVRMVYSPLDALRLARETPDREVVFYAIGFETTAPSTALTLQRARREGIKNFSVFCNHVTIVPPLRALLDSPDLRLDAFIGPGHVSTVIGCRPYEFIAQEYGKPVAVAGFEPLDLLQSILLLVRQMNEGRCEVENQYTRGVPWEGNQPALRCMAEVFEERPTFEWRGLGFIERSALKLAPVYADFDAEVRFRSDGARVADPLACQCGDVLRGALKPHQCRVFGSACTPETPLGALMVSSEGACAAYFNFGRKAVERVDLQPQGAGRDTLGREAVGAEA
jgi:hydrogenase expression/formation protein HypD